jgi:hypothetical protein
MTIDNKRAAALSNISDWFIIAHTDVVIGYHNCSVGVGKLLFDIFPGIFTYKIADLLDL